MAGDPRGMAYTVGYLGPSGTHSEEVARRLYPGGFQLLPFPRIDAVIRAVESGEIAEGIVPIENSLEGSVNITLDTLAHEVSLFITGEAIWPVKHHLLVKPGTREIRTVISHVQALAQCRRYLAEHFPAAEQQAAESTALAAQMVASGMGGWAAIGSAAAAQVYGLEIAAASIQDNGHNSTRFITVGRRPAPYRPGEPAEWKTSLAFQINGERPGTLCGVLSEFASRNVNLTRIESRPARTGLGIYIFFIDVQGSLEEGPVREAFEAVRAKSLWFKELGSYPVLLKG